MKKVTEVLEKIQSVPRGLIEILSDLDYEDRAIFRVILEFRPLNTLHTMRSVLQELERGVQIEIERRDKLPKD